MENLQGNISTIGVMIWVLISPFISQYITQDVFLSLFGILIVIWSAYNPNTFKIFKNAINGPVTDDESNNEYVTGDNNAN